MRVLLDTSVLIGNLHSPNPLTSSTGEVLRIGFSGGYTLLFVEGVVEELYRKLRERPDLSKRISRADAEELVADLRALGELVPHLDEPYRAVGGDRKDDFLFAHAIYARADFLVSWDTPLRNLKNVEGIRIVSPPELLHILRAAGRL